MNLKSILETASIILTVVVSVYILHSDSVEFRTEMLQRLVRVETKVKFLVDHFTSKKQVAKVNP